MNGEILEGLWLDGLKEGNFYYKDSNRNKYFRKYKFTFKFNKPFK